MDLQVRVILRRRAAMERVRAGESPAQELCSLAEFQLGCKGNVHSLFRVDFVFEDCLKQDACDGLKDVIESLYVGKQFKDIAEIEFPKEEEDEDLLSIFDDDDESPAADVEDILKRINESTASKEFKALAKEIASAAPEFNMRELKSVFTARSYLFAIGDGCGLGNYLNLLAELAHSVKLTDGEGVIETEADAYKEDMSQFHSALNALRYANKHDHAVISIDISEWADHTNSRTFKRFIAEIDKQADDYIIVFRVPYLEKDSLARICRAIADVMFIKTVVFPPFGWEETKKCASSLFAECGFTVQNRAWSHFFDRVTDEKSDGKFYGVDTIEKLVHEAVYAKCLKNATTGADSASISAADMKCLTRYICHDELTGEQQLDMLVGNEQLKSRIREIIAQIEISKTLPQSEKASMHMRFVGNPGTGKTTVARIIGKILKEKGILRVGSFFEYGGRDFCGRFIGETAPKTSGMCRDAYGSVLFIDEAYSLYRGEDNERDFGKEAIDTLIAEMENHRGDLLVIMAGYTDDMEKLLNANQGLKSRMPYTLEFPNFNREELFEIFKSMVSSRFKHDDSLFERAHEYFSSLSDEKLSSKEFSNARFVRNLFERTWAKAATRCQLHNVNDIVLNGEDFEKASGDSEFADNLSKKSRIGFFD